MMNKLKVSALLCAFALVLTACGDDSETSVNPSQKSLKVTSRITRQFSGNIESVRVVGDRANPSAVAVSSKSKTLHYLEIADGKMNNYRDDFVYSEQNAENEFTNSAVADENRTLVTHTIVTKDASGKVTDCAGEIMAIDYDAATDKMQVSSVEVGPMPDAVAVTPDKKYAISADEHDSADTWGKCPVGAGIQPSISVIKLVGDDGSKLAAPERIKQIKFTKSSAGDPREPEYIAVASDNDTVAATLQDSHEVAIFSLNAVLSAEGDLTEKDVTIVGLPKNAAGYSPWPDGITAFDIGGKHYFAMAGEANDTIIIIDGEGNVISNTAITEREVPSEYPCLNSEDFATVKYSPDSIASFVLDNRTYVAATLRYAGAVIIYDVSDPSKPSFVTIERAGQGDIVGDGVCKGYENMTKVYPEGISAGAFGDAVYIWIANEGDDTVTALKAESK